MNPAVIAALFTLAVPPEVALAKKVQAYYEQTTSLEAKFVQKYTYAAFGRSQTSSGVLRVKKPGKLRWDYSTPAKKTVLVNGSRLVQYEPEVGQAYVDEKFDASAMSAAVTFLLGKGSLEKEFQLSLDGKERLGLTPRKPDARVSRIVLTVAEGGEVTATRVEDGNGNVNELTFADHRRNAKLRDADFVLELPKDVHMVEAPQSTGASSR